MHNSGVSLRGIAEGYLDVIDKITPDVIDAEQSSRDDRGDGAGRSLSQRRCAIVVNAKISGITAMDRRNMLKSAASTALGTGLLAAAAGDAMSTQPATSREKMRGADYVGCPDGTKLACTDWGAGKPLVFTHPRP